MNARSLAVAAALLLASCARMVAPGGGPIDDIPPEVISVSPPPGPAAGFLTEVVIEWSERLDAASTALFLYPDILHSIAVSGSRVTVSLDDSLGCRTLVIHVPRDTQDRRGNTALESMDLVYSGEDSLPAGLISISLQRQGGGTISDRTLVEVWAADTDAEAGELLRRTTADSTATAVIAWLDPSGTYRLLCYEDPDRSFEWSSEREAGADTTVSFFPGSDTLMVGMTLTVVDTLGPILAETEALDRYHVRLEFTEEVSLASFAEGSVTISDTSGTAIPVAGEWLWGGAANRNIILETSEACPADGEFPITLTGIEDLLGNPSSPDSMFINATDSLPADSLRIRSHFPAPGSVNANPAGPYGISFTYFVGLDELGTLFSLTRVSDSTIVAGVLSRVDGRTFEFIPEHQLIGEQQHRFDLFPGLSTAWGDSMQTEFSWAFVPLWGDEPGSISGSIGGTGSALVVLQVSRTGGGGDASVRYSTIQPGDYMIYDIPAGRYTISCFVDYNESGTWDPSEPYGTYPGVVMVDPGLTSEGINIEVLP